MHLVAETHVDRAIDTTIVFVRANIPKRLANTKLSAEPELLLKPLDWMLGLAKVLKKMSVV